MRILHLENNLGNAEAARRRILAAWPDAEIVLCGDASKLGLLLLRSADFDVVVSEDEGPARGGPASLELVKKLVPETPFILLTSRPDCDGAVRALCAGASECVFKDRMEMLAPAIGRAVARRMEALRARHLERQCLSLANMLRQTFDVVVAEDQGGRISFWNRAAEQLLGWTPGEASGLAITSYAAPGGAAGFEDAVRIAAESGEWSGELAFKAKDGRTVTLESRRSLVRGADGRPSGHLTVGRDLTGRRLLEDQLYRSQRLECVSSLAAGIAHDLNNVLTPIIMAMGQLKNELKEPGQVLLMETLERSANRGAGLVRQMLSFTHGSSSPARALSPAEAVREVVSLAKATFPTGIALVGEAPDGLWPVRAYETHLHQVLLNLALNARDAMPAGGRLRIAARNLAMRDVDARSIRHGRAGYFVEFSATDTGTGVRPEDRERIWEPFFTTKPDGKGTGLGLPTISGIAARYGGFVAMDSTPGGGSCFRVFLPAVFDGTASDETTEAAGAGSPPETVLVIDPSREVRDLTTAVLRRFGYNVAAAPDGIGGAAMVQKNPALYSIVVSDLRAQGLGGGRLGSALRRLNPEVRLVFTGSGASDEEAEEARALGAQIVVKPFQPQDLLYAVLSAARREEEAKAG